MSNQARGYDSGFAAAKKLVQDSPIGNSIKTTTQATTRLQGTVLSVSGTDIRVKIHTLDPFADPALAERIVHTSDATQIVSVSTVSPTNTKGGTAVPLTPIQVSSIPMGAVVNIYSDDDISVAKEITAKVVQVLPSSRQ